MIPQLSLQECLGEVLKGWAGPGMENLGLGLIPARFGWFGTAKSAGFLFLGGKMCLGIEEMKGSPNEC